MNFNEHLNLISRLAYISAQTTATIDIYKLMLWNRTHYLLLVMDLKNFKGTVRRYTGFVTGRYPEVRVRVLHNTFRDGWTANEKLY